uniref:Protein FAM136A n=1 Tax=Canis lupus dingo TaxID=286419 RepID=A0A8C0L6Z5_CANLU
MVELQQLQVQEVVDSVVKSLERENIRKMQGLTFRCSTSCCEDSQASMQQVHQCIERCHALLAQAQALVTSELEKFQDRLARFSSLPTPILFSRLHSDTGELHQPRSSILGWKECLSSWVGATWGTI